VSYNVTREKAPLYTMGSPDPRAFSRNKRGIAGSLVWVNFDRHALLNLVYQLGGEFIANVDDLRPQFMTDANAYLSQTAIYQGSLVRTTGQSSGAIISQFDGNPSRRSPASNRTPLPGTPTRSCLSTSPWLAPTKKARRAV
jgi:hypothetical protein